jgi:hypothetical protein
MGLRDFIYAMRVNKLLEPGYRDFYGGKIYYQSKILEIQKAQMIKTNNNNPLSRYIHNAHGVAHGEPRIQYNVNGKLIFSGRNHPFLVTIDDRIFTCSRSHDNVEAMYASVVCFYEKERRDFYTHMSNPDAGHRYVETIISRLGHDLIMLAISDSVGKYIDYVQVRLPTRYYENPDVKEHFDKCRYICQNFSMYSEKYLDVIFEGMHLIHETIVTEKLDRAAVDVFFESLTLPFSDDAIYGPPSWLG